MTLEPHLVSDASVAEAAWFRQPQLKAIFASLNRDGHEARIVGGALRNALMGLPVTDIDLAVTATPVEVVRFAEEAGFKAVPTGIEHGTVTVVAEGLPFEVTTLRHDVETHGRRATVAFTQDWAADAARRDFTMNALYADSQGRVFDPLGGLTDIRAGRIRFIGSAVERIREDYLRILRFFRFSAQYGCVPLDAEGVSACIAERAGLAKLSAERIRSELIRILVTRNPLYALEPMAESGLLVSLLGGIVKLGDFARMVLIESEYGLEPVPIRRLGALAVMVEEDTERLAKRLRLSNAETGRLEAMAALEPVLDVSLDEKTARILLYRLGEGTYRDRTLIAHCRSAAETKADGWRALYNVPDRWPSPTFPLNGTDLMAHGLGAGPALGRTLRDMEEKWIASDFQLTREALLSTLSG